MELLESESPRPRQARYQAALRPDMKCTIHFLRHIPTLLPLRNPDLYFQSANVGKNGSPLELKFTDGRSRIVLLTVHRSSGLLL
jgi:hypothetical protein